MRLTARSRRMGIDSHGKAETFLSSAKNTFSRGVCTSTCAASTSASAGSKVDTNLSENQPRPMHGILPAQLT